MNADVGIGSSFFYLARYATLCVYLRFFPKETTTTEKAKDAFRSGKRSTLCQDTPVRSRPKSWLAFTDMEIFYSNSVVPRLLGRRHGQIDRRFRFRPHPQRRPYIPRALRLPRPIPHEPRGRHDAVALRLDEVLPSRHLLRADDVDLVRDLCAVPVQRQIIVVFAEGVLDFAADGRDAEDDVGAHDGAGDRDPVEGVPELEGQGEDVDPGYLADGDGVGDWEGGVDDAFGAGEDFVHGGQVAHY